MKKNTYPFLNRYVLLVVIHAESKEQVLEQVEIAFNNGVNGVFLINHLFNYAKLFQIYKSLRNIYPSSWIGINCLDLDPIQIIEKMPKSVDGVWVDNAFINEDLDVLEQDYAITVKKSMELHNWKGLYFGGVAFKYQKKVKDLIKATEIASYYMDVITTSGKGTGIAPDLQKIDIMSQVAHKKESRLGIASGVSSKNIKLFNMADCFLVATSISKDFSHLNPILVKNIVNKMDLMNKQYNINSSAV